MKTLLLAFALLIASTAARAVYLNPEGHGQALIFPYWTVQSAPPGAFNTYLSIVNRATEAKALRVRVREGRNGREVASFNLFLRGRDTWAAAIVPGPDGGTYIATTDRSCIDPPFESPGFFPDRLRFSNASYTGANADAFGNDPERLREGYVEVFEMASLGLLPSASNACPANGGLPFGIVGAPTGRLAGTLTLINVADGTDFTANAEALADLAVAPYFRPPADPYPDWNIAEIDRIASFVSAGTLYRFRTNSAIDAVDIALTQGALMGEVLLDNEIAAATEWVVTFPTLRLRAAGSFPFYRPPHFSFLFADREGNGLILVHQGCGFQCPGGMFPTTLELRYLGNVVDLRTGPRADGAPGTSTILGSRNAWITTLPTPARNGQAEMRLDVLQPPGVVASGTTTRLSDGVVAEVRHTIAGQPAVGFALRSFRNGNLQCGSLVCQGNYAGALPFAYSRSIMSDFGR